MENQRPWEFLPWAGEGFVWCGRWPAGALGVAAEAVAAETDQTGGATDQDHAEGGGFGDGGSFSFVLVPKLRLGTTWWAKLCFGGGTGAWVDTLTGQQSCGDKGVPKRSLGTRVESLGYDG